VDKELDKGLVMMGMPADGLAAVAEVLRAVIALDQGDCRTVLARLTAARKVTTIPPGGPTALVDLLAGTCEARQGLVAEARARLDKHKNEFMAPAIDVRWWVRQLEGEIALAAGDASAAWAAFQAGEPARKLPFNRSGPAGVLTLLSNSLILRDGPARVRIAQGRPDDAITIYRRLLVTDQASKYTSFFEPRYVLAIARLLDKTGKKGEARAEYKRFLAFWKDADPELPELAEARAKTR